jgi:hypothetical protein
VKIIPDHACCYPLGLLASHQFQFHSSRPQTGIGPLSAAIELVRCLTHRSRHTTRGGTTRNFARLGMGRGRDVMCVRYSLKLGRGINSLKK